MATLYLRPTADVYSTHPRYPSDSVNVYTLLNEEVCDGASTYIDLSPSTTAVRETYSSSFAFAGVDFPLKEFEITDIYICWDGHFGFGFTYLTSCLLTFSVESNGLSAISDVLDVKGGIGGVDSSFNRSGAFLDMLKEYIATYGKLPNINITVTTHTQESKNTPAYISQLYLAIVYNTGVRRKTGTNIWSKSNRVYKKIDGIWTEIGDGISQVGNRLNKKGHHHVSIGPVAPTCTRIGLTAGNKCSLCGEVFEKSEVIPATGHTPEDVAAVEPTCGAVGYTAGTRCSVCGEYLSGHEEIPATGEHTSEDVAAVEATCVKDGSTAGTKCSVCGVILSGVETIPATGVHTPVDVAAVEPTCGEVGYTAGTKCSVCGEYLSGHEEIPATGEHTPEDVAAVEATCGAVGYTAGTKCSVCGEYLSGHEEIPATGEHTWVSAEDGLAATDIDTGLISREKCSVCGTYRDSNYVAIPITGSHTHSYELVETKAATCIAEGYSSYYKCSGCGVAQDDIEILPIDPNNHADIVIDAAVNPSRTETGLTEGKHCAACGTVIVAQEIAPVITSGYLVHGYAVNDDSDGAINDGYFEEDWGYVIINGVKYLNQFSNVNVKEGDIVQVHVNAQYATHEDECWVKLNGVEVQSGSGTYNLTVTGDTTIVIARRKESSDWRIGYVWRARITMG